MPRWAVMGLSLLGACASGGSPEGRWQGDGGVLELAPGGEARATAASLLSLPCAQDGDVIGFALTWEVDDAGALRLTLHPGSAAALEDRGGCDLGTDELPAVPFRRSEEALTLTLPDGDVTLSLAAPLTGPLPRRALVAADPADGAAHVDPARPLSLTWEAPVDLITAEALTLTGPTDALAAEVVEADGTLRVTPTAPLQALQTAFTLETGELLSPDGERLAPARVAFTTWVTPADGAFELYNLGATAARGSPSALGADVRPPYQCRITSPGQPGARFVHEPPDADGLAPLRSLPASTEPDFDGRPVVFPEDGPCTVLDEGTPGTSLAVVRVGACDTAGGDVDCGEADARFAGGTEHGVFELRTEDGRRLAYDAATSSFRLLSEAADADAAFLLRPVD